LIIDLINFSRKHLALSTTTLYTICLKLQVEGMYATYVLDIIELLAGQQ